MGDRWAPWRFLLGDWQGVGGGKPGDAESGACTFALELADQVMARRNTASYAATADRPAFTHQDIMYVYPSGESWRAEYFDTEGHTIHYRATADGSRATFESDADASGMRYRLRYEREERAVALAFEIAAPRSEFASYITGRLERKP